MAILDDYVDEDGFLHNHTVPDVGQFRLRSACHGCDRTQAKHAPARPECLNGCFDLDYGEDEAALHFKRCTCTVEDDMAATRRFNALGITVVTRLLPRQKVRVQRIHATR